MPHIHVQQRPQGSNIPWFVSIIILLLIAAAVWYFFFGPGRALLPPGVPRGAVLVVVLMALSQGYGRRGQIPNLAPT